MDYQDYFDQDWEKEFENSLNDPMPWMGLYVAAASLVCSLAMAADVIHGIRWRKIWFPCKFFTMNATSLTILAVAMKLPMDLTTPMLTNLDSGAKITSEVFMIIVMGNLLISFASTNNVQSFMNIVALGILVVTIVVDVGIQLHTAWFIENDAVFSPILYISSMFMLLVTLSSIALTNPTTKRYMELKYNELHETTYEGGKLEEAENLTHQKLKEVVEKYWVMAETGSPQFVMARLVTSAMSGAICLVNAIPVIIGEILILRDINTVGRPNSIYRWSTTWIFAIQSIGMVVGIIAPVCRWFTAVSINCNNIFTNHHHIEFKLVENFWIQRLIEWKKIPLTLPIRGVKCKKVIRNLKLLILNLCIGVQIGIVVVSKLVQLISIIIALPFFSCFYYCKRMKEDPTSNSSAQTNNRSLEPKNSSPELDLYVLQLEGEAKLPKIILKNICHELNQVIKMGKSQQPKYLIQLLRKSNGCYKGVADIDSSQVLNSWTMPVVTLTSIAVALPNVESQAVDRLISSVSEGLVYTGLVEESFSSKAENMLNLKCAADVVWAEVELYRKWLGKDLRKLSLEGKTIEGILQTLVDIAEKSVIEYQRRATESPNVLAANSMYKISQTILKDYEGNTDADKDGNLFEQLSVMIADIFGACLSNLSRVVIRKCYCSAIEEREKSVRQAARLLGEIEEILEILGNKQLTCLSGDRAGDIEEGHVYMMQKDPSSIVPSSNNEVVASGSGESHINIAE
ncbi:hypothetical protein RHSIM_Rhsim07G0176400 [Rhododendron simsii]|uniref:Uncharacterized protein n=1 Tax=Rhododendron simsii TaxID=118357 RepID=A0A834LI88_RHOSS|nr:hypothetical protein RHSIM_Rhsim07G0176400 [Rhododendron simsii]